MTKRDGSPGAGSFAERYARLKNRQAKDWWTATFGDPLSWVILALIGDRQWLTPNRITMVSFLFKLIPAVLLLPGRYSLAVTAAIMLQLGQILDSMDGNLARYRGITSLRGGFLDRVLDGLGFLLVNSACAWYAYSRGAASYYLILGPMAAGFYLVVCYIYWTVAYTELKTLGTGKKIRPGHNVKSLADLPTWKYILQGQKKLFNFNQADFYFWIGLGLIIDRPQIILWGLFIVLLKKMVSRLVSRAAHLGRLESGELR
jgi:phosphatidylglycerophosphate synthase